MNTIEEKFENRTKILKKVYLKKIKKRSFTLLVLALLSLAMILTSCTNANNQQDNKETTESIVRETIEHSDVNDSEDEKTESSNYESSSEETTNEESDSTELGATTDISFDSTNIEDTSSEETESSESKECVHDYSVQSTEEAYLKSEATCAAQAVYYYSCSCGAKGVETFVFGDFEEHLIGQGYTCTQCGCHVPGLYETGTYILSNSWDNLIKSGIILDYNGNIDIATDQRKTIVGDLIVSANTIKIAPGAFDGCTSLTNITIPDSVKSIGNHAFGGCTSLMSITLPFVGATKDGADDTNFGYIFGAYSYSSNSRYVPKSLKTVVVTGSTSIDKYAFYECSSLTSVTIPDSVTSIGGDAFSGCSSLTSIEIPNSVTSIGKSAFWGCTSLTSVTIPDSVTSIGDGAFYGCESLVEAHISNIYNWCKMSIGTSNDDLLSCTKHFYLNGEPIIELVIPDSVTSIGEWAFSNCTSLESITIPDSVTSIGESAFYGCTSLTSITVPFVGEKSFGTSNTNFGYIFGAYSSNNHDDYVPISLKTVVITKAQRIDNSAFSGCSNITSIEIPNSVTSIGKYAFWGCTSLTSVTIPDSVTSIDKYAFYECSSLTSVTIPDSVTSIGGDAFYKCSSLTSITLPFVGATKDGADDTNFGYIFGAYSYSSNSRYVPKSLKTVVVTGSTSIDKYAFRGCSSLTSVTIPDSVTSIGYAAFYDCTSLTSITLPFVGATKDSPSNAHFGYIFGASSYSKNSSYVPKSLKTVVVTGDTSFTFSGCTSLTSVTIPDSVTSIDWDMFYGCSSLTSVTIPDSVTSIGSSAFYGCEKLKTVYYSGTEQQWKAISKDNSKLVQANIIYNYKNN